MLASASATAAGLQAFMNISVSGAIWTGENKKLERFYDLLEITILLSLQDGKLETSGRIARPHESLTNSRVSLTE